MNPVKPFLILILSLSALVVYAQDTTWYDAAWKKIPSSQGAAHFRTRTRTDSGWRVISQTLPDKMNYSGLYKDDSLRIRNGVFNSYKDGILWKVSTYRNDTLNGQETYYYADGKVHATGIYKGGEPEGEWIAYHSNGKLAGRATYDKGKQANAHFFLQNGASNTQATVFMKDARFPGGPSAYMQFLNTTFKYPRQAIKHEIQGTVVVQFKVTPEGKLIDFLVIRSVEKNLDEEALRVLRKSPDWEPAILGGVPEESYCKQPVVFKLSD